MATCPSLAVNEMQQNFLRGLYAAFFAIAAASVPVGTTLYLNGVAYSRFDRLTLNGEGNAGVVVDQSKPGGTSNYFDVEKTSTPMMCLRMQAQLFKWF
jgi:hypothetical protein